MLTFRLLLLLSALTVQFAVPSDVKAQYDYAVQGVAENDVLNIRERIEGADDVTSARIIGSIPANADDVAGTGLTVMVGGNRWHQVVFHGVSGWVNGRYLKKIETGGKGATPVFSCSGTEPFWSIELKEKEATFKNPFAAREEVRNYEIVKRRGARGGSHVHVVSMQSRAGKPVHPMAVLTRNDTCSDGMSDFTYPYEVILSVDAEDDADADGVWHGCCTLVR